MGDTGLELSPHSPGNSSNSELGNALNDAVMADVDLRRIVESWPRLSTMLKAKVLKLVNLAEIQLVPD